MALKKAPAAPSPRSRTAKTIAEPRNGAPRSASAPSSDPSRLLREAAWSRMFGRIESKNPFHPLAPARWNNAKPTFAQPSRAQRSTGTRCALSRRPRQSPGQEPPPRQFAGGLANLNYLIHLDGKPAVLRRPPMGELPAGAYDMAREFRILSRLPDALPFVPAACSSARTPASSARNSRSSSTGLVW